VPHFIEVLRISDWPRGLKVNLTANTVPRPIKFLPNNVTLHIAERFRKWERWDWPVRLVLASTDWQTRLFFSALIVTGIVGLKFFSTSPINRQTIGRAR